MTNYKTIRMGRNDLHIEAPGCIVNIARLHDADGREMTRVDVDADGDRDARDPAWWCVDAGAPLGPTGIGVRIVKDIPKPMDEAKRNPPLGQMAEFKADGADAADYWNPGGNNY